MPFAVVEDELVDVLGFCRRAQEEVLENGVVEDNDARVFEGASVDVAMELIVAEVIEVRRRHGSRWCGCCRGARGRGEGLRRSRRLRCGRGAGASGSRRSRVLPAFAEECGADADTGGAFFDGDLHVAGHAHGEVVEVVLCGEFAEAGEVGTGKLRGPPTRAEWS